MMLQPIVEGHGDVKAVPVLLRRLAREAGIYDFQVGEPIRKSSTELLQKEGLQRAVKIAKLKPECSGILVLFDSEDVCPKELAGQLAEWATEVSQGIPCAVVLPHSEYEAWFLASIESLRGKFGIRENSEPPQDPESIRGAKEALEYCMESGRSYHETVDQEHFSAVFDLKMTYQRSRSFKKLIKTFSELVNAMGIRLNSWPPADWLN